MPTFTCEKCMQTFARKSSYDSHINRKKPCAKNDVGKIIANKVAEGIKEVTRHANLYAELSLSDDEIQRNSQLQGFYENLHNLLWARAGLSPERALEHMVFFFAYRLIEDQADTLNLKQECRWSYMASMSNENDMFEVIKKGCTEFQKNSITKQFFKQPEIRKADIIYEIVKQIGRIPLSALHNTDVLGDIFEYMLSRGMSTMSDEGQYFTNRRICQLAFDLAYNIKNTVRRKDGSLCTFADWFCGTGGFPADYVKGVTQKAMEAGLPIDWKSEYSAIYCQDMNLSSVTTTLLNMLILTGVAFGSKNIHGGNSFVDPITMGSSAPHNGLEIDYCFMNPPYGGDKTKGADFKFAYAKGKGDAKKFMVNAEIQSIGIEDDDKVSAGVQLAMATLSNDGGVCSIVLPQGFFFGASKKCVELRKKIAEEYKIFYVVDIASGAFLNTGTKTSMMVFQKGVGSTEKVAFIRLDEKPLVEATLEDLRKKHYSLNYKQYLAQTAVEVDGFEMIKIKDILEFQKKPGNLGRADGKDSGKYPFYTCAQKKMYVDTCEFTKTCLIVNRGGMMNIRTDKNFSVSHDDIHVLSCIEGKTSELTVLYVAYYLGANMKLLENGMNGTTLKHLNKSFLEDFEIPLPALERQQQIVEAIDGWAGLAQQEEVALKILEKQVMFQVKEMGRGQTRVKLGEVCEIKHGKRVTKKENLGTIYPVYGGGDDTFRTDNKNREGFTCKVSRFGISEHNCVQTIYGDYWLMDSGFTVKGISEKTSDAYIYYWLTQSKELIYQCGRATAQMNMDMDTFRNLELPLPPLTEQQTLQSDFDEIRHKHAKIAMYKAKAQEAINRLIPGAT